MAYNKDLLKEYLTKKAAEGWAAFEKSGAYGSFKFDLIMSYINQFLPPENSLILDLGIDPGNYAVKIAQANRRLTIGDLSESQLEITRNKFDKYKLSSQIEQFAILDELIDLSIFEENSFDMVLCLSGTLSFTCEERSKMIKEIVRVTKIGAPIILAVKGKAPYFKEIIRELEMDKLEEPNKAGLWQMLETGYKQHEEYPGEPAYYGFTGQEITELLENNNIEILEIAGIGSIISNMYLQLEKIRENDEIWNDVFRIEKELQTMPGLWDAGEEILVVGRKKLI
ncbi:MAG: methyltransferase domain-containing protein [Candidatus Heimdallarchaeota archaeon]|nr:methyltransferase domain-containing protein [Candidatus Heimdallarchaeota archaeon]